MTDGPVTLFPMPGLLRYRLGAPPEDGVWTVEVSEVGSDEWHTLATHKSAEAAADQIHALNEAEISGQHVTPEGFVDAVKQVLQVKPEQSRPSRKR